MIFLYQVFIQPNPHHENFEIRFGIENKINGSRWLILKNGILLFFSDEEIEETCPTSPK